VADHSAGLATAGADCACPFEDGKDAFGHHEQQDEDRECEQDVEQVEGVEALAWVAISLAIDHEIVFGDDGARLT
jgi:hypothetical protein